MIGSYNINIFYNEQCIAIGHIPSLPQHIHLEAALHVLQGQQIPAAGQAHVTIEVDADATSRFTICRIPDRAGPVLSERATKLKWLLTGKTYHHPTDTSCRANSTIWFSARKEVFLLALVERK
jgi:hypothetical protein